MPTSPARRCPARRRVHPLGATVPGRPLPGRATRPGLPRRRSTPRQDRPEQARAVPRVPSARKGPDLLGAQDWAGHSWPLAAQSASNTRWLVTSSRAGGVSKVWNGAGDGTSHSSPSAPSQGRAVAASPRLRSTGISTNKEIHLRRAQAERAHRGEPVPVGELQRVVRLDQCEESDIREPEQQEQQEQQRGPGERDGGGHDEAPRRETAVLARPPGAAPLHAVCGDVASSGGGWHGSRSSQATGTCEGRGAGHRRTANDMPPAPLKACRSDAGTSGRIGAAACRPAPRKAGPGGVRRVKAAEVPTGSLSRDRAGP